MRRLTEFEKRIVNQIYESKLKGINFRALFKHSYDTKFFYQEVLIEVLKEETDYVLHFFKRTLPECLGEDESVDYSNNFNLSTKRFLDCLQLIYLLEENGLVYNEGAYFFNSKEYVPYYPKEIVEFLSYSQRYVDLGNKEIYFYMETSKKINEKDFLTITNATIQPSEALEIFVQNGFKTEEQKKHDDEFLFNKHSLRVAKYSALYALLAVGASVLFSAFTLAYTIYHDYKRDSIEDARYIKENIDKPKPDNTPKRSLFFCS